MNLPQAKSENIVVNTLKDEVLIYDLSTNQAFCLNETASHVFNACDGKTTFDELQSRYGYPDELIFLALDGLKKNALLADEYHSPFAGLNRREVIRRVGLASMVALPVISGLVAPTPAMAQSTACTTGVSQGQGNCPGGQRCVGGACSVCIPTGSAVPGGCNFNTVARCCTSGCNAPSGNCL